MSDSVKSTVLNGAGQAFYNNGREPTGNRSISGNEIQHVEAATQRLQSSKQNQRGRWKYLGKGNYERLRPILLPSTTSKVVTTNTDKNEHLNHSKMCKIPTVSDDNHNLFVPTTPLMIGASSDFYQLVHHGNIGTTGLQQRCHQYEPSVVLQDSSETDFSQVSNKSSSSRLSNKAQTTKRLSLTVEKLEYVPSDVSNFWHCPKCIHLPFSRRKRHSVIFQAFSCNKDGSSQIEMADWKRDTGDSVKDQSPPSISSTSSSDSSSSDCIYGQPPSSDDNKFVAIHSYLCRLQCEEMDSNESRLTDSGSSSSSDSEESNEPDYQRNKRRTSRRLSNIVSNYKIAQDIEERSDEVKNTKKDKSTNQLISKRLDGPEHVIPNIVQKKRGRPRKASSDVSDTSMSKERLAKKKTAKQGQGYQITKGEIIKIQTIQSDSGLVDLDNDINSTATIDYYIMSQVKRCSYVPSNDKTAYLRQKPLPEDYPGVQCIYCDKQWFFNSSMQLATGFSKIEQHLSGACENCPKTVKTNVNIAKNQETSERNELRSLFSDEKITRRHYANLVFKRLGATKLI